MIFNFCFLFFHIYGKFKRVDYINKSLFVYRYVCMYAYILQNFFDGLSNENRKLRDYIYGPLEETMQLC